MNAPTKPLKNMKREKTYYHENVGKVTVVHGISFASGQGEGVPLHLYSVGNQLHRIDASGSMPLGEVEVGEYEGQLKGWGIDDPITINGIVVSAAAIKSIGA
jgi:hypothetical protein